MSKSSTPQKPLILGFGYCMASSRVAKDGANVGYAYREEPSNDQDSGWRFFAGDEPEDFCDNADNFAIYGLNTIANIERMSHKQEVDRSENIV